MGENEKQVTDKGAVSLEENELDQASGGSGDFHIKFDTGGNEIKFAGSPEIKFAGAPEIKFDSRQVKL